MTEPHDPPEAAPEPASGDPGPVTTDVIEEPKASEACTHQWATRWQHPKKQRTARDCTLCGARMFTDGSDRTIGPAEAHAPWTKAEHKAAYDKAMAVKKN